MNRYLAFLIVIISLFGFGCTPVAQESGVNESSNIEVAKLQVVLPVAGYSGNRTFKAFGEYVSDRFKGYHVGDDVEFDYVKIEVPVVAIAAGKVRKLGRVSGYGGVAVIAHQLDNETVNAIYGHLDLASAKLKEGDTVEPGEFIANLGDSKSVETDGERKHLHFALYKGDDLRVNGYESTASGVAKWINPTDFFSQHKVKVEDYSRAYNPASELGGDVFKVRFAIPGGMEVEYIPELPALNVFTLSGAGTARERSQLFISYFDASNFRTLPTVTIHETKNLTVGQGKYEARSYDIEKKSSVSNFAYQPTWRNARHIVTDLASRSGFGRYYVFAKNPALKQALYEAVMTSLQIID